MIAKKIELICISILLCLYFYTQYTASGLVYVDTDNYMHALRTIDFIEHPSFFERRFMLTNYPFGEISHWTKLMDILMTLTAIPFLNFEPIRDAVFYGGFLVVPLSALALIYILHNFGIKNLDFKSRMALYLLLLIQSQFMIVFQYNRPDHHAVIVLFAATLFYLSTTFIQNPRQNIPIYMALISALSLWLAIEGFILYLITLIFLYSAYILYNYPYKTLQKYALSYLLFSTLFLILNPPFEGYFFFDNERLSILHISIAAYIITTLYLATYIKNKLYQFIILSLSAGICLICLKLSNLLTSPLPIQIAEAFTNRISEMKQGSTVYYLNYPCLGLLFLILNKKILKEQRLLLICYLLPYLTLSLWAMRFLAYTDLFATISIVLWLNQKNLKKTPFILITLILCATEIISFTIWAAFKYDLTKPLKNGPTINIAFFTHYTLPQGAVAGEVFITPQIIWYMHRPVIASPYHRNIEGILDNHNILFSDNEDEVIELIKKHHVSSILLPLQFDKDYYQNPQNNCDKIYGKMLSCHNYPQWLKEDTKSRPWGYILLEVISEKLP